MKIVFTKDALKELHKIPKNYIKIIWDKMQLLAEDSFARNINAKRLKGDKVFRLGVEDYRVIYEIHSGQITIEVVSIKSRGEAYD